jgi:hypothetical protein
MCNVLHEIEPSHCSQTRSWRWSNWGELKDEEISEATRLEHPALCLEEYADVAGRGLNGGRAIGS